MKKFLTALCTLITFTMVTVFCFTGCSPVTTSNVSANENDWVEVAEITYYISPSNSQNIYSYDEEHPLKIRFLENNCLEISYWESDYNNDTHETEYTKKSIRICPISYQIDYYVD